MKRNGIIKRILSVPAVLLAAVIILLQYEGALADAPYKTYTLDGYGHITETQTAYLPYVTLTKIGDESLNGPTDFTLLDDGTLYILDSGNKRVVVSDPEGGLAMVFGEDVLVTPKGIYVTKDGICYVADRDAKKIFVFDKNGSLINEYGRPKEAMYGETQDFLPIKIVVNSSGTMYVVCESNTNGIVQISPVGGGTFLGYFGTNATNAGLWNIIWRSILTDAQRAKMVGNIPATPDNMAIDEKGLIYTVTRGEGNDSLKRLNIAGIDLMNPDSFDQVPAAVAVGNHDNAFVVSQMGYIYEYNNDGELLFVFGGSDDGQQRIGLSTKVEAIQIGSDDKIYVLDSDKSQIQVYMPTEFTDHLHEALYLFSKGRYEESKEPLSKVLRMNNLFDYANMAMGRALYKEGDYEGALSYAKLAKDFDGYSDAYWEIRNEWLQKNLGKVIIILVSIFVVLKIVRLLDKKKHILDPLRSLKKKFFKVKLLRELAFAKTFMRHPVEGCYQIKVKGAVSVKSANILAAVFTLFFIINKYFCGFLMKTVREGQYDIVSDIITIVVVLVLVVGCNYLMCTINDGEGKLKAIYCSFIYSAGPYLCLIPFVFLLSHVVTYNEVFFIQITMFAMGVWIASLVFISIMEINDFTIKKTLQIIGLTIFTILIACLLAFIIYVLWSQVFDFISSLFGEVVYKLGN
jgi:sugar lactone lactonase YvrE